MLGLSLPLILTRATILIISLTFHEFSHAWAADRLGDDTPRYYGRLTLNPLKHLDVWGSLMLLMAGFGWAKPVPVNTYALLRRSPAGLMWTALAGPLANLTLAILAAIPFRLGLVTWSLAFAGSALPTLGEFLSEFILINLSLMLFNLLPIAPLDGDKVADYFFPPKWAAVLDRIRPYGSYVLLALFFLPSFTGFNFFSVIMNPALVNILNILIGGFA